MKCHGFTHNAKLTVVWEHLHRLITTQTAKNWFSLQHLYPHKGTSLPCRNQGIKFLALQCLHLLVHICNLRPQSNLKSTWMHLSPLRSIPRDWSLVSTPTWGRKPVLDTQAVWVTMRQTLRRLLSGMWICSSLMAALWTGSCLEKVIFVVISHLECCDHGLNKIPDYSLIYIVIVKLIFIKSHISIMVAFGGPVLSVRWCKCLCI